LKTLAPKDGEETALAERRTVMMQGEKIAADLREAQDVVSGNHAPVAALAAAVRRLERRAANSPALVEPAVKAIDIAINALEEADQHLTAALRAADFDPAELERIEERLFALRAASRKYSTPVDRLAALAAQYAADVALIDAGAEQLKKPTRATRPRPTSYRPHARRPRRNSTRPSMPSWRRSSSSARPSRRRSRVMRPRPVRRVSIASSSGCRPIPARGRVR
jgi:DNA repair protein RecN (Recombination protein N)